MQTVNTSVQTGTRPGKWHEIYRQLMESVGEDAPGLRNAIGLLAVAAILQGLAFACLLPVLQTLLQGKSDAAWPWFILMTVTALAACVTQWLGQGFDYDGRMTGAIHRLRTRLGQQLRQMPLSQLQDKRTGEMGGTVLGKVDENLAYVLMIVGMIFSAVLTPLAAAFALLWIDWRMALALALVFPAILPLYHKFRPQMGLAARQLAEVEKLVASNTLEFVQGLAALRAACLTEEKSRKLADSFKVLETVQTRAHRRGSNPGLLVATVAELGLLLVVTLGVYRVVGGELALASLAAICIMVVRFAEPLANFVSFAGVFEIIETALQQVRALLDIKPLPQALPLRQPEQFDIRFESVRFAYNKEAAPLFDGLDATLPARSMTAIVGTSGAGKTTLTRLLMRHHDVNSGRVLIGNVDVRQIEPAVMNELVAVVFQDVYLFDDTVAANLRMARPDATDEVLQAAARAAQCLEFIERLPQGWQTRLSEIGSRLSGGERQRLSIARALLKDAPIIVLDEPTAALDPESEVAVQRAIDALVAHKTVIVIAHRLSTIAAADQILVVEHGGIVESGNHPTLLAQKGKYWRMWEAQNSIKHWRAANG